MTETFDIKPFKITNYSIISISTTDKKCLTYCLARDINGIFEVLLSKSMTDDSDFEEEVENLAKYFNAEIVKEA